MKSFIVVKTTNANAKRVTLRDDFEA